MATLSDVQASEAAEHADLVILGGLVNQLLTAFASGTLTPAQAQALVDANNADDATVKTNIAAIQAALTPPAPAPAPAA